jgi:hypothetical protein
MSSASPWLSFLVGACLLALVVLAAMGRALAPLLSEVRHTGTGGQKQALGGLVVLAAGEVGFFVWMALAFWSVAARSPL